MERAVAVMTTLNAGAAEQARAAGAHALTDVTGFGLLGHVHELAEASGLAAEIDAARGARRSTACSSCSPTSAPWPAARAATAPTPSPSRPGRDGVAEPRRRLACDAMTSGGLLAAVAPERAGEIDGWVVGRLARRRARARSRWPA